MVSAFFGQTEQILSPLLREPYFGKFDNFGVQPLALDFDGAGSLVLAFVLFELDKFGVDGVNSYEFIGERSLLFFKPDFAQNEDLAFSGGFLLFERPLLDNVEFRVHFEHQRLHAL